MSIADGRRIVIEFTQPLTCDVSGLNPPLGYKKAEIDLSDAVATSLNYSSYPASYAIDGSISTYWRGTTAVNWLQVKLSKAKAVTQIKMYLGSYYIKTFTFSGSNDGITWVQLGSYTAANSTTAKWYTFDVENEDEYLYYKIDTLTTYSSTVYLYELQLLEDAPTGNETKFEVSFNEYDKVPGGTLSESTRRPESVFEFRSIEEFIDMSSGTLSDLALSGGKLKLATASEGGEQST